MSTSYYGNVRRDIESLLPPIATRIVDVGSGEGATAAWLKTRYPGSTVVALEGNEACRRDLTRNADEVHIVDLNGSVPDVGAPDLVLFLDVLEHLVHPEQVLARLTAAMPARGTVIVSVPNVAHASVSLDLLFRGEFRYQDAGILDRTHLRFFVLRSTVALLNSAGFTVVQGLRLGFDGPRTRLLHRLSLGILRDQLTKQYVLAARRAAPGTKQGQFSLRLS